MPAFKFRAVTRLSLQRKLQVSGVMGTVPASPELGEGLGDIPRQGCVPAL